MKNLFFSTKISVVFFFFLITSPAYIGLYSNNLAQKNLPSQPALGYIKTAPLKKTAPILIDIAKQMGYSPAQISKLYFYLFLMGHPNYKQFEENKPIWIFWDQEKSSNKYIPIFAAYLVKTTNNKIDPIETLAKTFQFGYKKEGKVVLFSPSIKLIKEKNAWSDLLDKDSLEAPFLAEGQFRPTPLPTQSPPTPCIASPLQEQKNIWNSLESLSFSLTIDPSHVKIKATCLSHSPKLIKNWLEKWKKFKGAKIDIHELNKALILEIQITRNELSPLTQAWFKS